MDRQPRAESGRYTRRRNLQIAVLGDSIAGIAAGVLLQNRGFDPVIATGPSRRSRSQFATIWNAGQRILGAVGIEDLETAGSRLERLYVRPKTEESGFRVVNATAVEYPHPIVVSTAELRDRLWSQLDAEGTVEVGVTDLHHQSDAVGVEFETGVREEFDLIVDARHPGLGDQAEVERDFEGGTALQQREISVPARTATSATVLEGWFDGVFLQRLPGVPPRNSALVRSTTARAELDLPALLERMGKSAREVGLELEATDFRPLDRLDDRRPVVVGQPTRQSLRTDRLVGVGEKAWVLPPATGLAVSLGIEDAWVLVDELETGSPDPTAVGQRYERRRQKRERAIRARTDSADPTHSYPIPASEPEQTIGRFRSAALGSFCSDAVTGLQEVLPLDR